MVNVRGVLIASFTDFDDEAAEAWDIAAEAHIDIFHEEKAINMRKNVLLPKTKKCRCRGQRLNYPRIFLIGLLQH